jgi:molybdenum cofactor guanylyltransferase
MVEWPGSTKEDEVATEMPRRSLDLTGFVLAGGASTRMGRPKEALMLDSETMLERQIRVLGAVCRSVAVVGRPVEAPAGVLVLADELPGRGPLGGISTGLRRTRTEFNLFLGCDLPFMTARFLGYLFRQALESRAGVTVPETPGHGYQPLCAVYRSGARAAVRAALAAGRNKVTSFYPKVSVHRLGWAEIARAGFGLHVFENMNTPADYEAARKRLHSPEL